MNFKNLQSRVQFVVGLLILGLVLRLSAPHFLTSLPQWWKHIISGQTLSEDETRVHEGRLMWWIHDAMKTGSVFRMKDLTDFDWDKLFVFGFHVTNKQISEDIGFKWKGLSTEDEKNEDLCFLIFVKENKVIQYFKYQRFYGDFSQAYQKGGYAPEEAIFTATKSPQLLHGEFPPLVSKLFPRKNK